MKTQWKSYMLTGVMTFINKNRIVSIFSILSIQYLANASATFSRNTAFEGYSEGPFKPTQKNPGHRGKATFPFARMRPRLHWSYIQHLKDGEQKVPVLDLLSQMPCFGPPYSKFLVTRSEVMVFSTHYGDIRVFLRQDAAPKTVEYMTNVAREGLFDGCSFYRAEPSGETVDQGREGTRRGYALVQGGLYSCGRQQSIALPRELVLQNNVGTVALITGTSEFFFNLEHHHDWDTSFNVWGTILNEESLVALQKIVMLPTYQEEHPSGTVMRILKTPVEYTVKLE